MALLVEAVRGSYNNQKFFTAAGWRADKSKTVPQAASMKARKWGAAYHRAGTAGTEFKPGAPPDGAPEVKLPDPELLRDSIVPYRLTSFIFGLGLAALLLVSGCGHRYTIPPPVPTPGPASGPMPAAPHWTEQGLASWYGVPYHGRRAADGEIYNMYQLVAAHRTLPFNSMVRVTDLQNGHQVVVRIIDRGPFVSDRIIDLSFAAARALDMVGPGVAPVRLELLSGGNPLAGDFTVQVGAFAVRANAERLRNELGPHWSPVFIQTYDSPKGALYRVRVGAVGGAAAAKRLATQLEEKEHFPQTFVVRLDPESR